LLYLRFVQQRVLYNKEIQTADFSDSEDDSEDESRQRQAKEREREVEAERIRDEELELESLKLDQEIEEAIRGIPTQLR
jgi:dynein intermediate chain